MSSICMETRSLGNSGEAGKGLKVSPSCTRMFVLDCVSKPLEKILLSRVFREVNDLGMLRGGHSGCEANHSTILFKGQQKLRRKTANWCSF